MRQQRMFISADIQSDGNIIGLLKKTTKRIDLFIYPRIRCVPGRK